MASENRRFKGEDPCLENPIARAAGEWLIRQDDGLTPRERHELARWLGADPRHAETYAEVAKIWQVLDRMPEIDESESAAAPTQAEPVRPRTHGRLWTLAALAAAITIAGVILWQPHAAARFTAVAQTEAGGWRRLDLPDGSVIRLNAESAVDVRFTARERGVRLVRGEANFAVEKDHRRPFVVRAGLVDVRAVGTAFDVRLRAEAVDVLVTDGKVRVEDAARSESVLPPTAATEVSSLRNEAAAPPVAPPDVLSAGHRATVTLAPTHAPVQAVVAPISAEEAARARAWQDRRLTFEDVSLAELVEEFNRYNQHQLVIVDKRIGEHRFGGTFPAGDHTTLVRLLEVNFGVIAERKPKETRLRLP